MIAMILLWIELIEFRDRAIPNEMTIIPEIKR